LVADIESVPRRLAAIDLEIAHEIARRRGVPGLDWAGDRRQLFQLGLVVVIAQKAPLVFADIIQQRLRLCREDNFDIGFAGGAAIYRRANGGGNLPHPLRHEVDKAGPDPHRDRTYAVFPARDFSGEPGWYGKGLHEIMDRFL
jgi:hypothetical protein